MDPTIVILGIIALFVIVVLFAVIGTRNGIVERKNNVKRNWANVLTYQRKRGNIIPEITKMLEQYVGHEQGVFTKVAELRSALTSLDGNKIDAAQLQAAHQAMGQVMAGIRVAVEAYPALKAADLYNKVMKELAENEENIAAQLVMFNRSVELFNNGIQTFPANVVNGMFNNEVELATFTDSAAQAEFEYQPNFRA